MQFFFPVCVAFWNFFLEMEDDDDDDPEFFEAPVLGEDLPEFQNQVPDRIPTCQKLLDAYFPA